MRTDPGIGSTVPGMHGYKSARSKGGNKYFAAELYGV